MNEPNFTVCHINAVFLFCTSLQIKVPAKRLKVKCINENEATKRVYKQIMTNFNFGLTVPINVLKKNASTLQNSAYFP